MVMMEAVTMWPAAQLVLSLAVDLVDGLLTMRLETATRWSAS